MKELENIIEQYILGNLSQAETVDFESKIAQDPNLKSEVDLQKDIVEAIKNHKRAAMKSKLAQIDPSKTVGIGLLTKKVIISAIAISAALLIGTGIYLKSNTDIPNNNIVSVPIDPKENLISEKVDHNKVEEKTATLDIITEPSTSSVETENDNMDFNNSKVEDVNTNSTTLNNDVKTIDPSDLFGNENIDNENVVEDTKHTDAKSFELNEKPIIVDCKGDSQSLTYKFKNNTLEVCGVETQETLTILEINNNKSTVKYLSYNSNYYTILPNSDYVELQSHLVKDQNLIKKLEKNHHK